VVGFVFPFLVCAATAFFLLHWGVRESWLAGVALSTTSVAVVYAVMLEFGLNRTDYGKTILAACFINDLLTVLALGLIFAPFTLKTLVFGAGSLAAFAILPWLTPRFFRRYGGRPSELEAKFLLLCLFGLGALAACGFKFFAGRVLALGEDEEPDYELSALEGGELIHDVLHRLVDKIDFRDAPGARAHAQEMLTAVRDERRSFARDQGFFDLRWRSIERTAKEFIEIEIANRAANPEVGILTEHKIRFALNDLSDPARVRLWLEGRIDRLELHPGRGKVRNLRVVDYKNSRSADRYRKLADSTGAQFGWTDFQLPVYLMGALSELGDRLAADATLEAGYLVLRNRDKEQIATVERALVDLDPKRRAAAKKAGEHPVAERIIALVDDALAGRFDVDPRQCDDWCPYRTVCRYYKTAEPGT